MEIKTFKSEVKSFDDKNLILEHWISTASIDDGGDIMEPKGMETRGRVVVLFQHGKDAVKGAEPIARPLSFAIGVNKDGVEGIIATTQYYDGSKLEPPDNTGKRLYEKAKGGFMPNWSIGWDPIESEPIPSGGRKVKKWRLLEYSQVAIGMNKDASYDSDAVHFPKMLVEKCADCKDCGKCADKPMFLKEVPNTDFIVCQKCFGIVDYKKHPEISMGAIACPFCHSAIDQNGKYLPAEQKGVIPYAEHTKDAEDAGWNGPEERAAAEVSDLKVMCAWYDSENPDLKNSYKLPHHRAKGYHTVWAGVRAAMGALLGARGGADIPEGDKKGVHAHLSKHYKEFKKEPPDLKEYEPEELEKMFPADSPVKVAGISEICEAYVKTHERTGEFKTIADRVSIELPFRNLQIITDAMFSELYSRAYSAEDAVSDDDIATEVMQEYIGLALPHMKACSSDIRKRKRENKSLDQIKTETKNAAADPTPPVKDAPVNNDPPSADKDVALTLVDDEKFSIPCSKEELKTMLSTELSGAIDKEIRKLTGKLD